MNAIESAKVETYIKKHEEWARMAERKLVQAVQRELHVTPFWDSLAQDWSFRKPGSKPVQAPRPGRRRNVRAG